MKVYIGGTMRASYNDDIFVNQDYRQDLAKILREHLKDVEIFDPLEGCDIKASNEVDFEAGKKVFFNEIDEVRSCDLLVVYLSGASMGTAIEMWEADERHIPIISITTMKENWTIKFLSDKIFPSMKEFEQAVEKGVIEELLKV